MKAFSIRNAAPSHYVAKTVRSRIVTYATIPGTTRGLFQLECGHVVERHMSARRARSICDVCTKEKAARCAG